MFSAQHFINEALLVSILIFFMLILGYGTEKNAKWHQNANKIYINYYNEHIYQINPAISWIIPI